MQAIGFKHIPIIVFLLGIFFACQKKEGKNECQLYGHAGDGLNNPNGYFIPNSRESVEYALRYNRLKGVEIDVQLSKEGQLWQYRHDDLETATDGAGKFHIQDEEYLKSIDYTGAKIGSLVKVSGIDWSTAQTKKDLFLDLKIFDLELNDSVAASQILDNIAFFDQYPKLEVHLIINKDTLAQHLYGHGYKLYRDISSYIETLEYQHKYEGFFVRNKEISKIQVQKIRSLGRRIFIYNIFSLAAIREATEKEPNGILVDDIKKGLGNC